MDLHHMSIDIIKTIDKEYGDFIDDDCLDIIQIKNICSIYKKSGKSSAVKSVTLADLDFSSPRFTKINSKINRRKKQNEILVSDEFTKKYAFFIRIVYACLKINIDIFNSSSDIITIKNNHQLIKSLEIRKKQLIQEHINILKDQHKNSHRLINKKYEEYCSNFLAKIKIIEKISVAITKLVNADVFGKTDNLLTLILPYFYTYTEFIEEYNE